MMIAGQQPLKPWLWMVVTVFLLIGDCRCATSTPSYCARFEFPELPGQNLTLPEGSLVNVSFQLVFDAPATPHTLNTAGNNNNNNKAADDDYAQCLKKDTINIGVSTQSDTCNIRVGGDGDCVSFTEFFCTCSRGGDPVGKEDAGGGGGGGGRSLQIALHFRYKLGLRDGGRWEWWTRDDMAPPASVLVTASEKAPHDEDAERPQTPYMVTASLPAGSLLSHILFSKTNPKLVHGNNNNNATILNINNNNSSTNDNTSTVANNGDDKDNTKEDEKERAIASTSVNVSYVGAVVAGVNVFTVIVIGVVIFFARRFCRKKRRLGRHCPPPRPCSMRSVTLERRHHDASAVYSTVDDKRLSTSSWLYDEISDDIKTLISTDTSLYLHPVECMTLTTPTTPTTPTAATSSSATTSTTPLAFSK